MFGNPIDGPHVRVVDVLLVVVVLWLAVIPLAGATIARVLTVERVTDWFRAQIEMRFPRGMIHYLSTCTVCMSYWTTTMVSAVVWLLLRLPMSPVDIVIWIILTLASIRMSVILAENGKSSRPKS